MAHCTMTAAVSCAMAVASPLHYHQQEHKTMYSSGTKLLGMTFQGV